jgi:hypothetical protein
MPSFNKGIYREHLKYEAQPLRKLSVISSTFRWFRPYAPGEKVDFKLTLQSLDGSNRHVRLVRYNAGKVLDVREIHYTPQVVKHDIPGLVVPGQGAIDYCFGTSEEDDSVLLVSVVASHNDQWIIFALGILLSFISGLLLWAIAGFINLRPFWDMWIP